MLYKHPNIRIALSHTSLIDICSAHTRIHRRQPRHVCPECGLYFEMWSVFKSHVQDTCHHEARLLAIQCLLCARKNRPCSWVDISAIFAHFYQSHIGLLYKCSACSKAYTEKLAIYGHREQVHQSVQSKDGKLVADFSLLYKAAFLKGPHKLFATREACEDRIEGLIKSWKKQFKFKCPACHMYFENSQELSSHDTRWCFMLHSTDREETSISKVSQLLINAFGYIWLNSGSFQF